MKIGRRRGFKVNMGHYESYEFGVWVDVSHEELGFSHKQVVENRDEVAQEMSAWIEQEMNRQLVEEVREAAELTDEDKSVVLALVEQPKPKSKKP